MDCGMVINPRRPVPKLHWLRSLRTPHPERVTSRTVAGGDPLVQKVADDKGLSPTRYPDELRQQVVRMVFEVRAQTGGAPGAIARVAELERENRELRRANAILKAATA